MLQKQRNVRISALNEIQILWKKIIQDLNIKDYIILHMQKGDKLRSAPLSL